MESKKGMEEMEDSEAESYGTNQLVSLWSL